MRKGSPLVGLVRALLPWAHWLMLVVTGGLLAVVLVFVDLKPQVDENFFFSSSDPQFKQSKQLENNFPQQAQLILSVATADISATGYLERIARLTQELKTLDGVVSVKSLTDGPKSVGDALASPLWRRLLIAENEKSSNLIVLLEQGKSEQLIPRIEQVVQAMNEGGFHIRMAGAPYVVAMMRRSLVHDFAYFSITAVVLFGVMMWVIFHSFRVFVGMLASCTSAVMLTLLIEAAFGRKIGILTVNLGTIVFVVALSHLVYLTFNWQTLADRGEQKPPVELAWAAVRMTFPPSFWSMVCATLGFASLLIVKAKPLRELGFGGVIGALMAMGCAYGMYPWFLNWAVPRKSKVTEKEPKPEFWRRKFVAPAVVVLVLSASLGIGLTRLNTDPSLFAYFKPHQELRDGLEYIDHNGGCNPLTLVVSAAAGGKLDTHGAYENLWALQHALENHPGVGAVISLPVVMAEGERRPLAFLLSWDHLLRIMAEPIHARIARSFINEQHTQAVFYVRMIETGRSQRRIEVVNGLRAVAEANGFKVVLVGGTYELQGELAKLVASSLVEGLVCLNVLFVGIALIVARSIRGAFAMIVSLLLVPLCMLGGVGWLRVPVDIISSPATNVCIGMAIDAMIHLMFGVRRAQRSGTKGWAAWVAGRNEQWRGVVYSDAIIAAGFGIFALSNFPPTQRFGLVVVVGTIIDILANFLVLPLLGGAEWRLRKQALSPRVTN